MRAEYIAEVCWRRKKTIYLLKLKKTIKKSLLKKRVEYQRYLRCVATSQERVRATAIRTFGMPSQLKSNKWGKTSRANISSGNTGVFIKEEHKKANDWRRAHWVLCANCSARSARIPRNNVISADTTRIKCVT